MSPYESIDHEIRAIGTVKVHWLIDLIQSSRINVGDCRIWKNVLNNENAEPILTGCSSDISYSLPLTCSSFFPLIISELTFPGFAVTLRKLKTFLYKFTVSPTHGYNYEQNKTFLCRNISIGVMCPSWKLWGKIFLFEERKLYRLNEPHMPKRVANLGSEQWAKFHRLSLFSGMLER